MQEASQVDRSRGHLPEAFEGRYLADPVAVTELGVPSVSSSGTDDTIGTAIARQIEVIAFD